MLIYLIRHPQTEWNKKGFLQGSKEGPISKEGKESTKTFLEEIKPVSVNVIYYAPNERCKYLSKKLSRLYPKATLISDERLYERSFGIYEGVSADKVAMETGFNPKDYKTRFSWKPEGGESLKEVSVRVAEFLKDLKEKHGKDDKIFVVTSGRAIKTAMYILGLKTLKESIFKDIKNLQVVKATLSKNTKIRL